MLREIWRREKEEIGRPFRGSIWLEMMSEFGVDDIFKRKSQRRKKYRDRHLEGERRKKWG